MVKAQNSIKRIIIHAGAFITPILLGFKMFLARYLQCMAGEIYYYVSIIYEG